MPLALTDSQLACVTDIARQLVPSHLRHRYLERVAELLDGQELGDGAVARAARAAAQQVRRNRPGRLLARMYGTAS